MNPLVLRGTLRVEHAGGEILVRAGEVVVAHPGEWVRYGTPDAGGGRIRRRLRTGLLPGGRAPR